MQAVISFRARGKGAFALRKDLKAKQETVCEVRRNPTNEFGASLPNLGQPSASFDSCWIFYEINCIKGPSQARISFISQNLRFTLYPSQIPTASKSSLRAKFWSEMRVTLKLRNGWVTSARRQLKSWQHSWRT